MSPSPLSDPRLSVAPRLIEIVERYGPCANVFDCGSRDALDGLALFDAVKAETLHVFEPNPTSAEVCRANVARHPRADRIRVNEVAMSDRVGTVDFFPIDPERTVTVHEGGNPGASSLFKANPAYPNEQYVQTKVEVKTTTMAAYCDAHGPCDLLWMDVQGAELMVLKGAGAYLERIRVIHTEISFREMYLDQPLFAEIDRFLERDFARVDLDLGRWPNVPWLYSALRFGPWVGNAIYVNRKLL